MNSHNQESSERELFETIQETYQLALEPEQHAMIKQLRHLPTIPSTERHALIDAIEAAIGRDLEEEYDL